MRRRQVLRTGAAVLVAVPGCTTTDGGGGSTDTPAPSPTAPPTDSPTASPSPSPTPTPAGTPVELVSPDGRPDVPVEYEAGMAEPRATGEHPARLGVRVRNPTDSEVVLGEERAVRFHHVGSEDGALYLLPADGRVEEFADPGCWRLREAVAVPEYYGTVAIPAGGSLRAESHVLGSAALPEGACLPAGEHRVATRGVVAPSADGVLEGGDDATEFEWGFTLRVG
jgi:hypothetical protein